MTCKRCQVGWNPTAARTKRCWHCGSDEHTTLVAVSTVRGEETYSTPHYPYTGDVA